VRELEIAGVSAELSWPLAPSMRSHAEAAEPRGEAEIRDASGEVELSALLGILACSAGDSGGVGLRLIKRGDLIALSRTPADQLVREYGLRPDDAARLAAAFELARRVGPKGRVLGFDLDEKKLALAEAEAQFRFWPYLHRPKRFQQWLREFPAYAVSAAGAVKLSIWAREYYSPEHFADRLSAKGMARSFRTIQAEE